MNALVIGGAGFVGSHLVRHLRDAGHEVRVFDLAIGLDARNPRQLARAMEGVDVVFHIASNTTVLSGSTDPSLDFTNGTQLTYNVVEAMRQTGVRRIIYSSSGSVYGDQGDRLLTEDIALRPNSPYAAQKVAGEALIEGYCKTFDLQGVAFRLSNIVGPGQTHGVAYDFIRKLRADPTRLEVLGDGSQRKSYLHVDDVCRAMLLGASYLDVKLEEPLTPAANLIPFDVFNLSSGDYLSVGKIAVMTCEAMGLPYAALNFGPTNIGWRGDIPTVHLVNDKMRGLGWEPQYDSEGAMKAALAALVNE